MPQPQRNVGLLKTAEKMENPTRNLLVLLKNEFMTEKAIEREVECLNQLLFRIESSDQFLTANELVDRNRITSNKKRLLKESRFQRLRPFRFLLGKN